MTKSIFTAVLVFSVAATAQTGTSTGTTTGSGTMTGTSQEKTTGTTATAPVSASGATDPGLTTDGQIAKVLLTVNEGEVEAADIAIKKAKNKEVRDFAKMMVKHHRENKRETKDLAKMTDRDATALSKSLKQDAKDALKNLKKESRESFDAAYIQSQIDMHQKALNLLDANLIPNAKSKPMRNHLTKTRETVSSHLTEAQNLKTKIE